MVLRRQGGVLLLRPLVDFYSGVDTLFAELNRSKFSKYSRKGNIVFKTLNPIGSKEERAAIQSPKIEQGRVFLPVKADWLEIFEKEIRDFPAGKNDDQVDSMVQFLAAMDFNIPWVNC